MLTMIAGLRVDKLVMVTRTNTAAAPGSSTRSLTGGGLPAMADAGTLSAPTSGRWTAAGAATTPYSLPPDSGSDGARVAPVAVPLCGSAPLPPLLASAGAPAPHASTMLASVAAAAFRR